MTLATATNLSTAAAAAVARINGVALHTPGEALSAEALRQRACTELLRQAAQAAGILDQADRQTPDGVVSEAAAQAIETLLEDRLQSPEPSDDECRRHHAAQASTYQSGEQVRLRHILFAVTPGVDVVALRKRAEATLLEVRSHADPFVLEHGQTVGRLMFERLIEAPQRLYGQGIGSNYQRQGLALSKHFKRS